MIQAVDEGGDGEIQLPEFLQLMADQMMAQEQDEELIAAFKRFGPSDVKDVITLESLATAIKKHDGEEFKEEDLTLIFNEISGAAKKPKRGGSGAFNSGHGQDNGEPRGISFTDFMLMMMAK